MFIRYLHTVYGKPPVCAQVVNKPDSHGGSLDWTKICEKSSKVITFIDLAGHEKYLKTTVFGMTGHLPDFCMLMVRKREEPLFVYLRATEQHALVFLLIHG